MDPSETRRTAADGSQYLDLSWAIHEGAPATINKVEIVGNDITHERVIREAIVLLPGDLFNRELLIRSYQNVSNLGFFQQPLPAPDVRPSANGIDVDIVFRVEEKRTGNINFGASLGQGTGVGGFLGLEEPNLFGRGKRGSLRWQFGANINDFTLSYTDPAIRESRVSGTLTLFDSRQTFIVGDLGRRQQLGGQLQIGFPFLGSRYTRIYGSYGFQRIQYSEGSDDLRRRFACNNCTRSTLGGSVLRDTRIGLPFPVAGTYFNVGGELNGGFLGGTGDYQKIDLEGRWYAPLGTVGGGGQLGQGVQFVLALTAKSGFIFGDAGPFFTELYSMGGVQFGTPLRGYNEFSITPDGYDPNASSGQASVNAFGKSFAAFTVEAGARISGALYVDTFLDAGNVYRSARQYDPTRLFRGAGFGAAACRRSAHWGSISRTGSIRKTSSGGRRPGGSFTSSWATSSEQPAPSDRESSMKLVHGTWIGLIAALVVAPVAAQQKPAKPSQQPKPATDADAGGATRIGFVNIQAILKASPGYAKAESTFAKELEGYRLRGSEAPGRPRFGSSGLRGPIGRPEPHPADPAAQGPRGAAGEAAAADPGAAAEGGQPGTRAAGSDPDPGEQRDRGNSGRR